MSDLSTLTGEWVMLNPSYSAECKFDGDVYPNIVMAVEASKRARELIGGSMPLIETRETKPLTIAIEEIDRGLITYSRDPRTELEDSGEEEK